MGKYSLALVFALTGLFLPKLAPAQPTTAPGTSKVIQWTPKTIVTLPADQGYKIVYDMWAGGDQARAQWLVRPLGVKYSQDLQVIFFDAACTRSHFDVEQGDALFEHVVEIAPDSPQAACAKLILKLDARQQVASNFAAMKQLVREHNDDALFIWMAGVMCRTLDMNEDGVRYFEHLCQLVHPGSSLVHQTYANLLDRLQRFDEALVHREIAVKLEPAGWTYQGMANTLDSLHRYAEASEYYSKAVGIDSDNALYWYTWANSFYHAEKFEEAITAARRATVLDPTDWRYFSLLAYNLMRVGRIAESLEQFKKVRELAPKQEDAYVAAAAILDGTGHKQEAEKLRDEWKKISGQK